MANNSDGIKTKVGVQGDKEYKQALTDIGRQLRVLNSDMKASQSAFGSQTETMGGMQDRLEKLNEIYEVQAKKVELIREQLEKAKEKYGENSKQADDLQIALNGATAAMNKTANQIETTKGGLATLAEAQQSVGDETDAANMTLKEAEQVLKDAGSSAEEMAGATEDAGDAAGDVGDAADDAADGVGGFGEALADAAEAAGGVFATGVEAVLGAMAAIGGAAAAALGEAFQLAQDAGKYADDLMTLSSQTGVDTDKLQQWEYASNFIDTSVDTITGSLTKLTKNMSDAQDGSESAQDKFVKLGVSWKDFNGNLRDNEDVFMDAIDALGKIENPVERDALAMELFGKSAKELNPLIEAGSRAWRDMGKEAEAMGTVFSKENLDKMGAFDDSMQKFKATGTALKNSIGLVMIPAFQPLVDAARSSMGKVAAALQEGVSPEELEELLDELINTAIDAFDDVLGMVEDKLPMVTGLLTRVINHIAEALPELTRVLLPAAVQLLESVISGITDNIEPLTTLATELVTNVAGFLIENIPELIEAAEKLLDGLIDGIIDALPELIPAAIEMIVKLAEGLIQGIPKLVEKLPEIVTAIWDGLKATDWKKLGGEVLDAILGGLGTIGKDIMDLLGVPADTQETIIGAWNSFAELISGGVQGIFGGVVDFLGGLFNPPAEGDQTATSELWNSFADLVGGGIRGILGGVVSFLGGLFDPPAEGEQTTTSQEWGTFAETVKGALETGLKGAAELLSGVITGAESAIRQIDWDNLGTTIGNVANGLVDLTDDALSSAFVAAHATIEKIDWEGLGTTIGNIANGLVNLTDEALSGAFTAGHAAIEKIDWESLGETLATVPNGLTSITKEALSGAFEAGYTAISGLDWKGLGDTIADGLNRGFGLLAGVGDVALGLGEAAVGAGQQGVGALKDWIKSWRQDEEVENEATQVGSKVITDLDSGVKDEVPTLETTAKEAGEALLNAIKGVLTEDAVKAIGTDFDKNLGTGIEDGQPDVIVIVQTLADETYSAMEQEVAALNFPEIGRQMDAGIAQGVTNNSWLIEQAARDAALAAYYAACAALEVHSPSKKGDFLGEMFDLGLAGGIMDNADEVEDAVGYLNDLAAADVEDVNMRLATNGSGGSSDGPDYDQMKTAFMEAIEETGAGQHIFQIDKKTVGESVEPYTSRATRQRQQQSVKGRTARLVMG